MEQYLLVSVFFNSLHSNKIIRLRKDLRSQTIYNHLYNKYGNNETRADASF